MKKFLICLLSLLMVLSLAGCGTEKETEVDEPTVDTSTETVQEPEKNYADAEFLKALMEGLYNRFDYTDALPTYEDGSEYQQKAYMGSVEKELDSIYSYYEEEFEDEHLKDLVKKYVDCLMESLDAASLITTDLTGFRQKWNAVKTERVALLEQLFTEYPVEVDESHKVAIEVLLHSEYLKANQSVLENIVRDAALVMNTSVAEGTKTYTFRMRNDFDRDFSCMEGLLFLYGKNGVPVQDDWYRCVVYDWKQGEVREFTFVVPNVEITDYYLDME